MATTYIKFFKENETSLFTKNNFEVTPYCKSKYENSETNMLNRLRSAFVDGINEKCKLPRFVVLVLDDDLIEFLRYEDQGISSLIGSWVEWIAKKLIALKDLAKSSLPGKATKDGYPQFYWVAPPHHRNFYNNFARTKLTNVLESVFKTQNDMRVIRMKEKWDYENLELVDKKGIITDEGYYTYWESIDAAVKFNVAKRDYFLASQLRNNSKEYIDNNTRKRKFKNENQSQDSKGKRGRKSDMEDYFKKNKKYREGSRRLPSPPPRK